MKIVIPINMVPDLVEELEIDETGTRLDLTWARMILNEFDDHAIEQGILFKERDGGHVTVLAPDIDGVDDALFSAGAKGADRLIKLTGDFENEYNSHALSRAFFSVMNNLEIDLILTGVQGHWDVDGQIGPLLAEFFDFPYVGYIAGAEVRDGRVIVLKEYPGGLIAEMEVSLPAVLGIQAAAEPPRYVAYSKIRNAMKELTVDEIAASDFDLSGGPTIRRMYPPESTELATMLEGSPDEVSDKLISILNEAGVI